MVIYSLISLNGAGFPFPSASPFMKSFMPQDSWNEGRTKIAGKVGTEYNCIRVINLDQAKEVSGLVSLQQGRTVVLWLSLHFEA